MRFYCSLAIVCLLFSLVQAADARKSNIVIIVADDLGYADIGAQGISSDVKTPHIDSIAKNGARFTSAYVTAPVCSPSRAGFLTGRYQQRFGHELNPLPAFDATFGLPLDQVMLPAELKRAGYATGMAGKWHLGNREEFQPHHRGFDEFFGFLGGAHSFTNNGTGPNALRRNDELPDEKEYLTDAITREAVSFIDRHSKSSFLLYVPYSSVHAPQEAPQKYVDRFVGEKDEKRRMMLAMLSAADDGVGLILDKLRSSGLEDDTLIVFFSDNGGPTESNSSRNTPFRGHKGELWEGGIRIPFMMQLKGRIAPGRVYDMPITTLDVFPTALAAAGITPRDELKLDGVNLIPWLEDNPAVRLRPPHDVLYWRFSPQWAIREGEFKLVKTREQPAPMLFDLSKDPGETTDLFNDRPRVAHRLREKFDAWSAQLAEPLWPGRQEGARKPPAERK